MSGPRPQGVALPAQPDTLGALEAMRAIILSECLVGGVTPFAALIWLACAAPFGSGGIHRLSCGR